MKCPIGIRLKFLIALLAFSLLSCRHGAQPGSVEADSIFAELDGPKASLLRLLLQLQTRASFIMFTAHPDDEDGATLVYETLGQGARGALFTITRGEGGQNVMTADLDDSLGLIRTQELLRSDRYYGVDQYFSRMIDYGFSKSPEEALEKWNHDQLLSDAVRVIRTVRPLVVISEFLGTAIDGHGHHQVAGRLAREAFVAAGDPKKFSEQFREGLRPWSPLKLYARVPNLTATPRGIYDYLRSSTFNFRDGWQSTFFPTTSLRLHVAEHAIKSRFTYFEVARGALSLQRTQGGGGRLGESPVDRLYHRYLSHVAAAANENSFFEGINVELSGINSGTKEQVKFLSDDLSQLSGIADSALKHYETGSTCTVAEDLAKGLQLTRSSIERVKTSPITEPGKAEVLFELQAKEQQFENALAEALAASLKATVAVAGADMEPPGQNFQVEEQLTNDGPADLKVDSLEVIPSDGKTWKIRSDCPLHDVNAHTFLQRRLWVTAPLDATMTRPYFYRPNKQQSYYDLIDERYRNLPLQPYPLFGRARLSYHGVAFEVNRVVETTDSKAVSPTVRPLLVGPAISVTVSPSTGAVPLRAKSFAIKCSIHSNVNGLSQGMLRLGLPTGWRSDPPESHFLITQSGGNQNFAFSISPFLTKPGVYRISASASYNSRTYTESYHLAGYPGLTPYPSYRKAEYHAVVVDVVLAPDLKIAFLPTTDDEVPKALDALGQKVHILTSGDLMQSDLNQYDSIVLGSRAYELRDELKGANNRLLNYVRSGGVLIVQYNLRSFDRSEGPYPLSLGASPQKVVDENSPIRLLDAENPVYTWPNTITKADFQGWIEERGHGFLKTWDPNYAPLLETHDPGQEPQKGGLLFARYGRGFYVYTALALNRQLPAGVPGALRLLANLVSLKKSPKLK